MKPLVAIVGRPNVGKSTLFNRLVGRHLAIVEDVPGVTRDRHYADTEWNDRAFTVIDTGGFVPGEEDELLKAVREQAQLAVEECDVILFVVDGRTGLTAADQEVGSYLRKSGKPVVVAANKIDSPRQESDAAVSEFHRLGLGDVFGVSAEHARGLDDMLDELSKHLPPAEPKAQKRELPELEEGQEIEGKLEGEEEPDAPVRLAIIGRPNVGKSTLINAILGENRLVASNVPGTTRDPIDSELEHKGRRFILTDTAGIRRKKTIAHRLEKFTVVASLKVVERSDVAVLLMDATEPAVDQDAKLAGLSEEKGRALLVVVNKWDKVAADKKKESDFRDELKYQLKFVAYAPVIFTSALHGTKVGKVLEVASVLAEQFRFRAPTPQVNRLVEYMAENHPAPIIGGRPLRLYYMAQVATAPPTFMVTCNVPAGVPDDFKRYVTNQLRKTFDLRVPIRIYFRPRPGQAKRAARKNVAKLKARKPRRKD